MTRLPLAFLALALASPLVQASTLTTDATTLDIKTGDSIQIHSTFTNTGPNATGPQLAYLTLIDVKQGVPVDLEDWTANRSTNLASVLPHASVTQTWTLRALTSGDFAVYVVAIPNGTTNAKDTPIMSAPVQIHVTQRTNLNPGGVLPVALGIPVLIIGALAAMRATRSRNDDRNHARKETPE